MRNEYDFSQSRKNPYVSEDKAQSDVSAELASETSFASPATSAFDWDGAFVTRSSAELRANLAAQRGRSNGIK